MSLSSTLLATGQRLLRKYGQNITFSRVVEGTFVPSTGAVGAGTTTSFTAYGAPIFGSGSLKFISGSKEVAEISLLQQDLQIWVEVNDGGDIPLVGDTVSLNGKVYRVLAVTNSAVQGTTCIYKIQVRI